MRGRFEFLAKINDDGEKEKGEGKREEMKISINFGRLRTKKPEIHQVT